MSIISFDFVGILFKICIIFSQDRKKTRITKNKKRKKKRERESERERERERE